MDGSGGGGRVGIEGGGFVLVVASALCYSTLGVFGKIAYSAGVGLLPLLASRFTLAAACFWILVLLTPRVRSALVSLGRGRALVLVAWGVFGYAGQAAIFFTALLFVPASLAVVLLYTSPAFLALIHWLGTGRRPGRAQIAAVALALPGAYLCAAPQWTDGSPLGVGLAIAAGFWYACFLLGLARVTPGAPSLLSGAFVISGAALTFTAAALVTGRTALPHTASGWGALLGLVVIGTLLSFLLFIAGLKRVGPHVASILNTFEPIGTVAIAGFLLDEQLLPSQYAGAALVVAAAFVLAAVGGRWERMTYDAPAPPAVQPRAIDAIGSGAYHESSTAAAVRDIRDRGRDA